jgi:ubiquinone/menaquinone biosynthesis C-methylase UbiE
MPQTTTTSLPQLRFNNRYLLEWMRRHNGPGRRMLDYGCGDGTLVFTARQQGIDAYGAETYYDGARPEDLALGRVFDPAGKFVRVITSGKLAYPDEWFDLVVANQVFEHIQDLQLTAKEIHRVMKVRGTLITLFPTRCVVREPHLCVPWIHRMPRGNMRRVYYRLARHFSRDARRINWGHGQAGVDKAMWFLDNHTCYRSTREAVGILSPLFDVRHIEPQWLSRRVPKLARLIELPGMGPVSAVLARLAGGTALAATKRP